MKKRIYADKYSFNAKLSINGEPSNFCETPCAMFHDATRYIVTPHKLNVRMSTKNLPKKLKFVLKPNTSTHAIKELVFNITVMDELTHGQLPSKYNPVVLFVRSDVCSLKMAFWVQNEFLIAGGVTCVVEKKALSKEKIKD